MFIRFNLFDVLGMSSVLIWFDVLILCFHLVLSLLGIQTHTLWQMIAVFGSAPWSPN